MVQIKTLCSSIDAIDGGIEVGVMTEVCGESGSGKTTLCMQLAISAAMSTDVGGTGGAAIYLHSKSPFPTSRLQQIMQARIGSSKDNEQIHQVMHRILVKNCCDPNELRDFLTEIDAYINANKSSTQPVRVLVVDSICDFFYNRFPYTKEGNDERNMLLRAVGFALKNMARKYNIAVVATNGVADSYEEHNRNHFCTSSRIVKPKIVWNFEKFTANRWILMKDVRKDGSNLRTLEIRYEDRSTNYTLYGINNGGVCDDSYDYGATSSSS